MADQAKALLLGQIAAFRTRGLARNGLFSLLQSVVTIVCVFLSYRIMISTSGLSSLGLWSLLMTFSGVAMTADVSGAAALARSVARQAHENADATVAEVIHTVLLTSLIINLIMVLVFVLIAPTMIQALIQPEQRGLAWGLLPWAAALMVILPFSIGIASSIDGLQRADKRAVLLASAAVAGLSVAWFTIPRIGAAGLALAQFVQQVTVVCVGWLILRRQVPDLGWFPLRWRGRVFKRTTSYAIKLNAAGLFALLFEPLTKFCINGAGGTAAVGVYELAARLIVQIRTLVVSAVTPLIPAFAAATGPDDPRFSGLLRRAQAAIAQVALVVALGSLVLAPAMSLVILGRISVDVLRTNAMLTLGWSLNLFALPLYLAAQGYGWLRWNIASHALLAFCVVFGSLFLAPLLSINGVLIGAVAGLTGGGLLAIVGNARLLGPEQLAKALSSRSIAIALLIASACAAAWLLAPLVAAA